MTDDIRRTLSQLDGPRRPTAAGDARIREKIEKGIDALHAVGGHPDDEPDVLDLESEPLIAARPTRVTNPSRWLSYAAILLIGFGALAVMATRRDTNDITTAPVPSDGEASLTLQVADYCRSHVAPVTEELERWNGTYYYLFAEPSEEGGAIAAALSVAADQLTSLGSDATETRTTIHREVDAMPRSGLAQRNVHLQAAIAALASHLGTLPGSDSCQLESLLAVMHPPGGGAND